jgi:hypothetical protein
MTRHCRIYVLTVLAVLALVPTMHSQASGVIDATVCGILSDPKAFDGKTVRIKATVLAGFDEFILKDTSCKQPVNDIWLSYPEGTKAKSGPAVVVQLQLAKNSPGQGLSAARAAITLDKSGKDFKQFDSLLSASYKGGRCLGCIRSTVTATLTGHIDAVAKAGLERDASGMVTAVNGFGNLGAYSARLVLQSVADVAGHEIDYKAASGLKGDAPEQGPKDPIAAAQQAAKAYGAGSSMGDQIARGAKAYGAQGEDNGVNLGFGATAEVLKNDGLKGEGSSPDGVLYFVNMDMDRLKNGFLAEAIAHTGTHIADIREKKAPISLYDLETQAWQVTIISGVANREKSLVLPGGTIGWNMDWPDAEKSDSVHKAIIHYIIDWAGLSD